MANKNSIFFNIDSPFGDWEKELDKYKKDDDVFITEISGHQEVEIGNFYVFAVSKFSKNDFDFKSVTSKIRWGYATKDSGIIEINKKINFGTSISWQIPELKNETIKIYAWFEGSNRRASLTLDIISNQAKFLTYFIHYGNEREGIIEKLLPQKIKKENQNKIQYFYIDRRKNKYDLGVLLFTQVTKHEKKGETSALRNNQVMLVDIRTLTPYFSENINYGILGWNSKRENRWYINPDCLAGLLGAMIENNITDLGFNGFSTINGDTGPTSNSHINGVNGDLAYLSKKLDGGIVLLDTDDFDYERQVLFNKSLHKYFWGRNKSLLSEFQTKRKPSLLPFCINYTETRHNNHLHIQGFDFSKILHIDRIEI